MVNLKNNSVLMFYMDKKMHCPRCSGIWKKRFMAKIKHPSGAVLDVCNHCGGMWLDAKEVKMLYNFSGKQKSRGRK